MLASHSLGGRGPELEGERDDRCVEGLVGLRFIRLPSIRRAALVAPSRLTMALAGSLTLFGEFYVADVSATPGLRWAAYANSSPDVPYFALEALKTVDSVAVLDGAQSTMGRLVVYGPL